MDLFKKRPFLIRGPIGSGKSSLLDELATMALDIRVMQDLILTWSRHYGEDLLENFLDAWEVELNRHASNATCKVQQGTQHKCM